MPKDGLEAYLERITPTLGDPTYSILKSHLIFEDLLRIYLDNALVHPKALEGARLTFAQLLAVARAVCSEVAPSHWMWKAIGDLNKLRNLLAHNLADGRLAEKMDEYVAFVVTSLDKPLPPSHVKASDPPEVVSALASEPLYLAVDLATVGLYGFASDALGLPAWAPTTTPPTPP
jgi:hypothetical protein